jgi:hypothetical protein
LIPLFQEQARFFHEQSIISMLTRASWIIQPPIRHITMRDTQTLARKPSLKEQLRSDWLAFASFNYIVSIGKASEKGTIFIMLTDEAKPPKMPN